MFTEKDHSKDTKPDFNAAFGKFGSALIISLHEDGSIYGCQVAHSAHQKQGFSSIGNIEANDFSYEDGKVEGELTTTVRWRRFGETWEVNLKFVAPLGAIPKQFQVAETREPEKEANASTPNDTSASNESDDEPATQSAAGAIKAKDLALTKDASDFEYKAMVRTRHLQEQSECEERLHGIRLRISKPRAGPSKAAISSIPRPPFSGGNAARPTLTIFVKPEGGGSEIKIFTKGLSWDEK